MAALTLSPRRNSLGLYFRTIQDGYFQTANVVVFLRDLLYHIPGRIIVVWDGWKVHQPAAKQVLSQRLDTVTLPSYAPELNPVEQVWNRLKWTHLANFAPVDSTALHNKLRPLLEQTANSFEDLRTFWQGAKLPLHKMKFNE